MKHIHAADTMVDVTEPEFGVQVEYDEPRGVLYVHCDGITVLRICQIKQPVFVSGISDWQRGQSVMNSD